MLQVRVSVPDSTSGIKLTDPIILENADDITLTKTVSSSDQSIQFKLGVNDPKIKYLVYTRWWECWDTEKNIRLNFGPITSLDDSSGEFMQVQGSGRPQLLADYTKTAQTFYEPIDEFLDSLRYENLTGLPKTSTIINTTSTSDYYGLSKRSKDFAIDEQTGFILPGRDTPTRGTIKTTSFWTGVDKADFLIVDLGELYTISKLRVLLPWWGGATINNDRTYDWSLLSSPDNSSYTNQYSTPVPNLANNPAMTGPFLGGRSIYFGESGFESDQVTASANNLSSRYWKINITDAHAWIGNFYAGNLVDGYDWECLGTNIFNGASKPSPTNGTINKTSVDPTSDCHASVVEFGAFRTILGRDTITSKSYKQVENNNLQISYVHSPISGEMITTGTSTIRKFEPGSFFRKIKLTWSGGVVNIKDEYNTVIYTSSGSSGTNVLISLPAYTRVIQIEGSSNSLVTWCDAWQSKLDAFSFGGSYSFSKVTGDTAIVHFRGTSIKWLATIPSTETGGHASIEIRNKADAGTWSGWTTLAASLALPNGISAQKVWEITPESGTLSDNTIYEIRITNLDGNLVSIDAFAGFWSGTFTEYNEDSEKFGFRFPSQLDQEYDPKFSGGSIYRYKSSAYQDIVQSLIFTGDRVIVYSRKGVGYGKITIGIVHNDATFSIPGGDADGRLTVNLNSSTDLPQAIIFDSNDYFPNMAWGQYFIGFYTNANSGDIWIDGVGVHETQGLSVKFIDTTHLDILKSVAEALQMEWDITEQGIIVVPRLGTDTNEVFKDGTNSTIKIQDTQDVTQVATLLYSNGGDIDGLPLTTIVEDKVNRTIIGRTIARQFDLRGTTDYFTLIGASRAELIKRRYPQKRIVITRVGDCPVNEGDSFIAKTNLLETRVRANTISRSQSKSAGLIYTLECTEWPQIP